MSPTSARSPTPSCRRSPPPRLRLDVVQRSGAGSLVVLEEDERRLRIHLSELADDMTRAGVAATPDGMAAALSSWVAHRPVTDAAAATGGTAVLDWRDRSQTTVGWRVVVRRGELALPWTPSAAADRAAVHRTRSAATGRAHDVSLDLRVEGPVALWSHREVPVLATASLVAPERMLDGGRGRRADHRGHARGGHAAASGGGRRAGDRGPPGGGDHRGQRHAALACPRRPALDLTPSSFRSELDRKSERAQEM